ncbi:MAG: hypothetical protein DRN11_01800, partial [Thermoplasmata archaeon]
GKYLPIVIVILIFVSRFTEVWSFNSVVSVGIYKNQGYYGKTLYVGGDGPGNYSKIQDAINNASDGDTIIVYPGIYYENIIVDKSIRLIGENKETTIIDGMKKGNVIKISANNVVIKNFTIRKGYKKWYLSSGILINSSYNSIYNCNICSNEYGISVAGNGYNRIEECHVYFNNYTGILLSSPNNIIRNCKIYKNEKGIESAPNNTILSCEIFGNEYGIWSASNNTIKNCSIYDNIEGLEIFMAQNNRVLNNRFQNDGIIVDGVERDHFVHYFENNTINDELLLYLFNQSNIKLEGKAGQIILAYCKNIVINNIRLNNTDIGIEIIRCSNISVSNCKINENNNGIYLLESEYIKILENTIESNEIGINIAFVNHTIIAKNTISCNDIALSIFLYNSKFNTITKNNFIRNRLDMRYCVLDPFKKPSYFNIFIRNYWSRWHLIVPKPLLISLFIPKGKFGIFFPWIKFDFLPKLIPYWRY